MGAKIDSHIEDSISGISVGEVMEDVQYQQADLFRRMKRKTAVTTTRLRFTALLRWVCIPSAFWLGRWSSH